MPTEGIMENLNEVTDDMVEIMSDGMDQMTEVPMDTAADMIADVVNDTDDDPGDNPLLAIVKTGLKIAAGLTIGGGIAYGASKLVKPKHYNEVPRAPKLMTSGADGQKVTKK